jgi:YD repeat-containing protein
MTGEARPDGSTSTTFDPVLQDRKVTVTDQAGRTTVSVLSPERWLASSTDPKGLVTSNSYDTAGNRTSTTAADGAVTSWAYEVENRLVSMVDPRGNVAGATPADYRTSYG